MIMISYCFPIFMVIRLCLYNVDPLKPHFYIEKSGIYKVIHYFFFISAQKHSGYSLEPPRRGGSNEYPQSMF